MTLTLSPKTFMTQTGVSRETLDRFIAYAELLEKWQKRINLVGPKTIADLWRRHFLDSAQVHTLLPPQTKTVLDLGSGAGFPGLVLALMGVPDVHLAESDQRKCAFLREAARVCGVSVTVHAKRIESIPAFTADVVTARALAPISDLLTYAEPFLGPHSHCLFLKGQNAQAELDDAAPTWVFRVTRTPSCTDPDATLLDLQEVSRHD